MLEAIVGIAGIPQWSQPQNSQQLPDEPDRANPAVRG